MKIIFKTQKANKSKTPCTHYVIHVDVVATLNTLFVKGLKALSPS